MSSFYIHSANHDVLYAAPGRFDRSIAMQSLPSPIIACLVRNLSWAILVPFPLPLPLWRYIYHQRDTIESHFHILLLHLFLMQAAPTAPFFCDTVYCFN